MSSRHVDLGIKNTNMIIWFSLLIPILAAGYLLFFQRRHIIWWEVAVPIGASLLLTVIFKLLVEQVQVSDTEYWGGLGVRAQYYEYWETWVDKTCSKEVACGKDSNGNTKYCTEYYDCSYCDEHEPYWLLIDDQGNSFNISEQRYRELRARWVSQERFVDQHRDIDTHGSLFGADCGKDGDMYEILWNRDPLTAEHTTVSHTYENRVQAAHTAFDYPEVTDEEAAVNRLFDYPEVQGYTQDCVLGEDSVSWMNNEERERLRKLVGHLNGEVGPRQQLRVFLLFFRDTDAFRANLQEAYWMNGNKNEVVICMGLESSTRKISWVRPFSWTPERRVLVDLREDLMMLGTFDPDRVVQTIARDTQTYRRKEFREFSYVTVDPPTWSVWVTYLLTLVVTVLTSIWVTRNEIR